jgi:hypothetical protein
MADILTPITMLRKAAATIDNLHHAGAPIDAAAWAELNSALNGARVLTDLNAANLIEPAAALEPEYGPIKEHIIQTSIAISLKRIADWLDGTGLTSFADGRECDATSAKR